MDEGEFSCKTMFSELFDSEAFLALIDILLSFLGRAYTYMHKLHRVFPYSIDMHV